MIRRLALVTLAVTIVGSTSVPTPARAADTLETVLVNGPAENRIDLVIIGDGYTAAQAELFRQHTDALLLGLFSTMPWSGYRGAFNIYRIVTESNESGADHPSQGIAVDTYFDGTFEHFGIERLTHANEAKVIDVVTGLVPEVDQIVLILNDPLYGGSGGTVPIVSATEIAAVILTHELGHSFANLADEYTDPVPGYPLNDPEPNVDLDATFDLIKWSHWIEASTPLPTLEASPLPDPYGPIGAYEGARYFETGIYRSAPRCLMRSVDYDYCAVCAEALVLGVWARIEPIDDATPQPGVVAMMLESPASYPVRLGVEVVGVDGAGDGLTVTWSLDGTAVGQGPELLLDPVGLGLDLGQHQLSVAVSDDATWVRRDPQALRRAERQWTVFWTSDPSDAGPPGPDAGPDPPPGGGGCGCGAASSSGAIPMLWLCLWLWLRLWPLPAIRRWPCRTRRSAS